MAAELKPAADELPELAYLRAREKELVAKADRIAAHPETKDHDLAGAKQRNDLLLKQVRSEIKRLEKK